MVKNTKGGKGAKGLARKSQTGFSSVIRYSNDELEQYGCVTKMFGNGMCQITLEDEKTLIGHIRNKFRGRQKRHNTINVYGVVLIGLREWEKTPKNCDILFIYDDHHLNQLNENPKINIKNILQISKNGAKQVKTTEEYNDNFIISEEETHDLTLDEIKMHSDEMFIVNEDEEISIDDI